jgi:hypothetical protein
LPCRGKRRQDTAEDGEAEQAGGQGGVGFAPEAGI